MQTKFMHNIDYPRNVVESGVGQSDWCRIPTWRSIGTFPPRVSSARHHIRSTQDCVGSRDTPRNSSPASHASCRVSCCTPASSPLLARGAGFIETTWCRLSFVTVTQSGLVGCSTKNVNNTVRPILLVADKRSPLDCAIDTVGHGTTQAGRRRYGAACSMAGPPTRVRLIPLAAF